LSRAQNLMDSTRAASRCTSSLEHSGERSHHSFGENFANRINAIRRRLSCSRQRLPCSGRTNPCEPTLSDGSRGVGATANTQSSSASPAHRRRWRWRMDRLLRRRTPEVRLQTSDFLLGALVEILEEPACFSGALGVRVDLERLLERFTSFHFVSSTRVGLAQVQPERRVLRLRLRAPLEC